MPPVQVDSVAQVQERFSGLDTLCLDKRIVGDLTRRYIGRMRDDNQAMAGLILHGPPGTGKTSIAKGVAKDAGNCCFIFVSGGRALSKW